VNGAFDGVATCSVIDQRVTSALGWADAADADWGDSALRNTRIGMPAAFDGYQTTRNRRFE
jgi:hypothetical protein